MKHIEILADPTAGEVRIGTSIVIASGFAAATIDRLSRRHPRIEVFLVAGEGPAMYRDLEERKVDLLISRRLVPIVEERMHCRDSLRGAARRGGRRRESACQQAQDHRLPM